MVLWILAGMPVRVAPAGNDLAFLKGANMLKENGKKMVLCLLVFSLLSCGTVLGTMTGAVGDLYVARYWSGGVYQFDQTTGALVPNSYTTSNSFGVTGHGDGSIGLLWRPDGSGLLVNSSGTGPVVEINGQNGSTVGDLFTTELNNAYDMVWGPTGATVLVVNRSSGSVQEFNGTTGAWIRTAAAGVNNPLSLVLNPITGNILVGTTTSGVIKFDYTTGNNLGSFASIGRCEGLMVNQAGNLWASDLGSNTVKEFQPDGTYVRDIGSVGLTGPGPITVRPTNGNLLVANGGTEQILEYNGSTGAFVGVFVSGINTPLHMGFKPVPEPSTLGLLVLGVVGLIRRR